MVEMGKCARQCTTASLDNSIKLHLKKIHPTVSDIHILADGQAHTDKMGNNGQAYMCKMGKWQNAIQLQVETRTSTEENPSSSFRDMCSCPWESPYGFNGQVNITVHNYRIKPFQWTSNGENMSISFMQISKRSWNCTTIYIYIQVRQFHQTLKGVNPSSGFRDMCAAKPNGTKFDKVLPHRQAYMGHMGKWLWHCTTSGLDNLKEL